MADPGPAGLPTAPIRLIGLPERRAVALRLDPTPAEQAALAAHLGLSGLSKLRFVGRLVPEGRHDWRLTAEVSATVTQPCVITLAAVRTPLREDVMRHYMAELPPPGPGETEMPEDDSIEPLPAQIDLWAIASEALALALPPFPRAPGAVLGAISAAPPGAAPISAPLAGLAALRDRILPGPGSDRGPDPGPDPGSDAGSDAGPDSGSEDGPDRP